MHYYVTSPRDTYEPNNGLYKLYSNENDALNDAEVGHFIHLVEVTTFPVVVGGKVLGNRIVR